MCFQTSVLASSAAIISVIISLLIGIPTLLLGLLGGIHLHKRRMKCSGQIPLSSNLSEADNVRPENTPVYEEINDNQIPIVIKQNIAYEDIQM